MHPDDAPPEMLPRIAVVICTRFRPSTTRDAVASVLAARPAAGLVIIVDQADPESPDPLREFDGLPGVTRIRHRGPGLSRARNVGAAAAEAAGAAIVAYTDDDCTADPGWLAAFEAAFARAERVGMVFGSTKAAPYDRTRGIIPAYEVAGAAVHRGIASKTRAEGMGACMAVDLHAWRDLGGFDDRLGAGTALSAAEDTDLVVRMLVAGFAVAETPDAVVVHHGFRDWNATPPLVAGYMRGIGAAMAKMIRLAGIASLRPLARLSLRWLVGRPVVDLNHLPSRSFRLAAFLGGARVGWKTPLESRTGRFLPYEAPEDLVAPSSAGALPVAPTADGTGAGGSVLRAIARWQMTWLFNGRLAGWMRDPSLRRQLPFWHRLFCRYCLAWMAVTGPRWIVGGKQMFFLLAFLNRLTGGPSESMLTITDTRIGLDLGDPRSIKVVHELLPGSGETAVLTALLAEGDSFVDIGANHGAYSLVAGRIVGPGGEVVAVEAQPRLARLLERSLDGSVACRHTVRAVALGDRSGEVPFYVLRRNSGQSGLFRGPSTSGVHTVTSVPMARLDDTIDWRALPGEVVVKIDVEGAEERVLAGATAFFGTRQPVLLMEVNPACMAAAGVTWAMLVTRLLDLGYDRFAEVGTPFRAVPLGSLDPCLQRDVVVWPAARAVPDTKAGPR